MPTAAQHTFTFDAEDIGASHGAHYSHYIAENPSDPAHRPYHRVPLAPIHINHLSADLDPPPLPPSQAPGTRHAPTSKAGGSRRKRAASPLPKKTHAKGKRRCVDSDVDKPFKALTDSEDERPIVPTTGHGGRCAGAGNYKDVDLTELLNLTEKELPVSQHGWQKVYRAYEAWANANGRPLHDARSLELKFKSVSLVYSW